MSSINTPSLPMDPGKEQIFRTYAWSYFSFHADQRMKTFNFFLVSAGLLSGGIVSLMRDMGTPWLIAILGMALIFLCFLFWRLDRRNKILVRNGEAAIKYLDAQHKHRDGGDVPHVLCIVERDDFNTKGKCRSLFHLNEGHFGYSQVIGWVYGLFAALGFIFVVAAFFPMHSAVAPSSASINPASQVMPSPAPITLVLTFSPSGGAFMQAGTPGPVTTGAPAATLIPIAITAPDVMPSPVATAARIAVPVPTPVATPYPVTTATPAPISEKYPDNSPTPGRPDRQK